MHKRAADLPPAVGVLVEYDGTDADAARGVAMQIAAMRPQYLTRDEVPADVVEKERAIAEATAREEGKPEAALAKIVEGRLNGFFKDVVLLDQASVTESKKSVKAVLDDAGIHGQAVRPLRGRRLSRRARRRGETDLADGTGRRLRRARDSDAPDIAGRPARRSARPCEAAAVVTAYTPGPAQAVRRGLRRRQGRRRPRRRARHRRADRRGAARRRAGRRSSSAAATSSAAPSCSSAAWTAPAPTTWACSAP